MTQSVVFALRGKGGQPVAMQPGQDYPRLKDCPSCQGRGWFLINPFATRPPPAGGLGNMAPCLTCVDAEAYWKEHGVLPPELVQAIEDAKRLCNLTACKKPGATWWNPSTRAYYCPSCAAKINKHNPGLCVPSKPEEPNK